jgi:hypothetical protein
VIDGSIHQETVGNIKGRKNLRLLGDPGEEASHLWLPPPTLDRKAESRGLPRDDSRFRPMPGRALRTSRTEPNLHERVVGSVHMTTNHQLCLLSVSWRKGLRRLVLVMGESRGEIFLKISFTRLWAAALSICVTVAVPELAILV